MKYYTYYLSGYSVGSNDILDGYYFTDPIYPTQTPSYPLTADGGITEYAYTSSYDLTAWDGYFYPYGNIVQDGSITDIIPDLKGDYTITFCASAIPNPIQIIYDFGDGATKIVQRISNKSAVYSSINNYIFGIDSASPRFQLINHTYFAPISSITLFPSITVINSNLSYTIFNLSFTQFANSLYDTPNIHLLDSTQQISYSSNSLNIVEIKDYNIVSNILTTSRQNNEYTQPYLLSTYPLLSSALTQGNNTYVVAESGFIAIH